MIVKDNYKCRSYEDRLNDGHIVSFGDPKERRFNNSIKDCAFLGLNGDNSTFKLTEIDELNSFTVHMEKVAIIPLGELIKIIDLSKAPDEIMNAISKVSGVDLIEHE